MVIKCFDDKREMAKVAADQAASVLRQAIKAQGKARLIAATGAAQFEFLDALTSLPGIDRQKVEMFHLDEYIGTPASHPASFCRFLQERLIRKTGITRHHLLNPEEAPVEVIRRTSAALIAAPIDVAFVGIGENGGISHSMILPPISKPRSLISWSSWTSLADASNWAKDGSLHSRTYRNAPSR